MISKERLEELIGQKKSIYWKFAKIKPSSWSKYTIMGNTIVKGNLKEIYSLDDLFETKEDFEWHREFGCITRTEILKLPTWEEIDKEYNKSKHKRKKFGTYEILKFVGKKTENDYVLEIFVDNYTKKFICLSCFVRQPLTKENYILACRKAKELFLGE